MAREISIKSNNQNGIKPRDLRSNDDIQVRLQAEFGRLDFEGYTFDVKRGEAATGHTISNEQAGKLLLAFDLEEPWSCHQTYKVFDEQYAEIFARPEVDAYRIIVLSKIMELIEGRLDKIQNAPLAHYGLTKYVVLAALKKLISTDELGSKVCREPRVLFRGERLEGFLKLVDYLLLSAIIDLNHEVAQGQLADYKSELKSRNSVEKIIAELLRSYEKDRARGKADSVSARLAECGIR